MDTEVELQIREMVQTFLPELQAQALATPPADAARGLRRLRLRSASAVRDACEAEAPGLEVRAS
jgi:hypothetical protein